MGSTTSFITALSSRFGADVRDEVVKTQDRQPVPIQNIDDGSVEEKRQEIIQQQIPASQSLEFPLSLKDLSQDYEIDLIKSALENCQYNQKKTADALKLTYHQLRGYLKKYNLLESAVDEG